MQGTGRRRDGGWITLGLIALVTALPEIILWLADLGLVGSARWRPLAYQYGAFWTGLLRGWEPNFPAQPVTMFLSYAVLHVGMGHLAGNLAGLFWLGREVEARRGPLGLVAIWIGAALGGAVAFGLLAPGTAPMVGASGAVFGLGGAWVVQNWQEDRREGQDALRPALWALGLFVALNLLSWLWEDGALAWQTHLGGALAGAALALVLPEKRKERPRTPL